VYDSGWQHPFVNVFRQFSVDQDNGVSRTPDVERVMVSLMVKPYFILTVVVMIGQDDWQTSMET